MIFTSNKIFFYRENEIVKKTTYSKSFKDIVSILKYINKQEKNRKLSMSVHFVDSKRIKQLNKEHRNKNMSTDVLSFPHNEFDMKKFFYIGDVFINEDIIETQSKEINSDPLTEVKFLAMHGILHLIGYDHIEKKDEKKMLDKQKEIFKELGIRND